MRIKARIGFAVLFCGLLATALVKGWLWYNQLTERIFASVQQQTGFKLDAKRIQYDLVNEKLRLNSVSISAPGLDVSARSLELGIASPRWRDIGRQVFPVTIEYASFAGSSLHANSPQSLLPLTGLGNTFFHKSVMHPGSGSRPLSLSFLSLTPQPDTSIIDVESSGDDGLSWSFAGTLDVENNHVSGALNFEQQDIARFLSDSGYSGHFDASLDFSWSGSKPLLLTGNMQGSAGSYQSEDFLLRWEGWQFSNIQLIDWQLAGNNQALQLDKAELQLSEARITRFFNWLKEQPFYSSRFDVTQLNVKPYPDSGGLVFSNANLMLNADNEPYQFTAKPSSGGRLSINADSSGAYQLKLENVTPQRLGILSAVQQSDFADKRYHFFYNSHTGMARLLFRQKKALKDYSFTERLLFDANGRAELSFVAKGIELLDLRSVIGSQINKQLEAIRITPFTYLSQLTDKPLMAYLEHTPGKPDLTLSGEENLKTLKKLSALRPGIKWQLETRISDSEDWPQIARNQLEQTLIDLYQEDGIPPEHEREKLIEQLYLVTQKQKMPDVGLVSKNERVLQAEQWLIDSWPKNPELIDQLLAGRKKQLAASLENNGLHEITILSTGQTDDQPRSRLLIK